MVASVEPYRSSQIPRTKALLTCRIVDHQEKVIGWVRGRLLSDVEVDWMSRDGDIETIESVQTGYTDRTSRRNLKGEGTA